MNDKIKLSHLDHQGAAHMVDVSHKVVSSRTAKAYGEIHMSREALNIVLKGNSKKGDVLGAARIAAIMGAKRTDQLIPLCHPLPITGVEVDIQQLEKGTGFSVAATVRCHGVTGVEMEALTAVSVCCLTIYDMVKAVDKSMVISRIQLEEKHGGKSGSYRREGVGG